MKFLKIFFSIVFLLVLNFYCQAQDSLFIERQISNEAANIPNENVDLSKLQMQYSSQFAEINLRRNKFGNQSGKFKIAAHTNNNLGVYFFQQKNFKTAESYFQEAMQSFNASNSPKMLALMTARLGYVYDMDMDFDKALDLYKQSLRNFEQLHLEKQLAEVNYLISKLYIKINKADEASDYLKQGIEASGKSKTSALGNKMTNLLQSIEQSKKERNTRLLQLLAVEKNGFQSMSNSQKGKVCKEIGYNYWGGSEFEKANNYFNKSATYYATAGEMPDNDEAMPDATQALLFKPHDVDDLKQASRSYDRIRDSILRVMISTKSLDKKNLQDVLGAAYSKLSKEQINALTQSTDEQIQKLVRERDSLSKSELNYNETDILAKESLIKQLMKEKEVQAYALKANELELAKRRLDRYWMFGIAAVFLLIAIFIFIIYRNNQRALVRTKIAYKELNETHDKLKTTQQQLVQSEKMAGLGQLTAGVAHEINNPINFVSSSIGSLKRDVDDLKLLVKTYQEKPNEAVALAKQLDIDYTVKEIDELMQGITEGANRTAEIVKGLRNFSRTDEAEKKNANINECLDSTIMILQTKLKDKNIELKKQFAQLPDIACYPGQLNQVFMNIISNAADAIEGNNGEINVVTKKENNNILVSIKDNGKGMTDEVKKKIFDPFFTTKDVGSGTGLGLSIAYGIMEKHNAKIEVESEVGKGTTFIVSLPTH